MAGANFSFEWSSRAYTGTVRRGPAVGRLRLRSLIEAINQFEDAGSRSVLQMDKQMCLQVSYLSSYCAFPASQLPSIRRQPTAFFTRRITHPVFSHRSTSVWPGTLTRNTKIAQLRMYEDTSIERTICVGNSKTYIANGYAKRNRFIRTP